MQIDGKVALVTGASGGIGSELVRQLLERGAAKVYAGARRETARQDPRVVPL
ncbi:SDR family NAD(P)-dependent oxidoreductase, partial [Streptomyces sp. NPDC054919]